jgi:hypothetical protein
LCYQHPHPNVELSFVDEQGGLHVFLNDEARTFDGKRFISTRCFFRSARNCGSLRRDDLLGWLILALVADVFVN